MTLDPVQRGLEGIARELLAPVLHGAFAASGWNVVSWDAEQGICLTLEKGRTCLLLELEERNDRLDCYARTRRFNVCVRRQFDAEPLTDGDRACVDALIGMVRRREGRLPDFDRPTTSRRTVIREVLVDRVLIPEGRMHYYMNPYVGCMIGCPFCYVIDRADFSRRLEGLPWVPWGHYVDVKVNAAEVLRHETETVKRGIVRLSPILTDPYQSIERHYRITRQCLEVLVETDLAPVVLTRAPRILDDLELLTRFRRALVGFSIPTDADESRQIFEPGADPIPERLDALRALHGAGVGTFAVIQPILPMHVDRLVSQVAPFVRAVRIDRLYLGERVQHLYDEHGLQHFATEAYVERTLRELTDAFAARGVRVDPLDDLEALFEPR